PVLGFLIDFVVQRPDHILQVAEVINILLTSDDWVAALQEVMQDLVLQLTSEQQAVLGVQNDVLLAQLPQTAVDLAHEQASKLLQDAGQVRKELDRVRAGLGEGGLRFKSSVQELRFEPSYRSGGHVGVKRCGLGASSCSITLSEESDRWRACSGQFRYRRRLVKKGARMQVHLAGDPPPHQMATVTTTTSARKRFVACLRVLRLPLLLKQAVDPNPGSVKGSRCLATLSAVGARASWSEWGGRKS
ncbi:unnamed protein product, partial [Symbiodinium sp. KB8]